ncbi:MAG: hypothetical protein M5U01_10475 [Ardenticatenaceae bacterium]|nr:hypothetical protein [Ardenticatenaceae bacterium]
MQGVKWATIAFGVTLALIVGLQGDAQRLAVGAGILIGMVVMLPLSVGLLLTLAAYRPSGQRIAEGRSRVVERQTTPAVTARTRRRRGWTHVASLAVCEKEGHADRGGLRP